MRHEVATDQRNGNAGRRTIKGAVNAAQPHDSAAKHVTGSAIYIDDMPEPSGLVHACLGLSEIASGRIAEMDLAAVRSAPGVLAVLTADDIPGSNDISPTRRHDEPVFASDEVGFFGQPLFAVIAETRMAARRAVRLAKVTCEARPAIIDITDMDEAEPRFVTPPLILQRGEPEHAMKNAPHRLQGTMRVGGQDHFYLEGQIALAVPGEDDDVTVFSSTQHPSEVQHMVARVLGTASHSVTVEVRRMGGGFGGKETQANIFAVVAALAAKRLNRAVKLRPDRDDDMIATGKRHDFLIGYDVGFDDEGKILAVDFSYAARCGFSSDLSGPVTDRALFHCDNCYFYPAVKAVSAPLYTNTVSNTAFRGFGGPQGMLGAERVIDEVAFALNKDSLEIRRRNFYRDDEGRDVTPYHQKVEDNIIARIVDELEAASDYQARRGQIAEFNKENTIVKRGIALTPVKFGISFTATHFNQAGALVHAYTDGSVHLNHGGTEMGQGLYVKVAQVVAQEFCIDIDHVKITATTTGKVPNTSATAASSGSDLNGMAALDAARTIRRRLVEFACRFYELDESQVEFLPNEVRIGNRCIPFAELVSQAYVARVQLSAAGFYRTPSIHWDRDEGKGRPFYYFAYGAAVSEVSIDTLTGEYRVDGVDILHDVGHSLNPAIDIGQIEGGFVQGMGWLTTEELWWDDKGRLRTHAPSTYKIPLASDIPERFNVDLVRWSQNIEPTIHRSKAVGEPPLMLAMSVLHALSDAVASVADHKICPCLDAPATPERVLFALQRVKEQARPAKASTGAAND